MIYEPNTNEWPVGALVIHDADAKRPDMLMQVTGRDKATGEYKTRYAYPAEQPKQWRRKVWKNDKRYLHDPARFGIKVPNVQLEGAVGGLPPEAPSRSAGSAALVITEKNNG